MGDISKEEQYIINCIKNKGKNGSSIGYRLLQDICADEFEGVRLILKKMKEKGILDYDGMIPGFSAQITLK